MRLGVPKLPTAPIWIEFEGLGVGWLVGLGRTDRRILGDWRSRERLVPAHQGPLSQAVEE